MTTEKKVDQPEDLAGLSKADREAREREELVRQERSRRGLPPEDAAGKPEKA